MRLLLGLIGLLLCAGVNAGGLVVVVDKSSPVTRLDQREVASIFLAKTNRIELGGRVVPLELNDTPFRQLFYRQISGKSLAQINSYWTTLIFTGKGRPPKKVGALTELIELLASDPHAITYLPADQITDSMKVVHHLP